MERVPPSQRTREEIRHLLEEGTSEEPSSKLIRLAVRRIVEEALEGEVRDHLGRDYYRHGNGQETGYRNGYREGKLKTAEGEVSYAVPQVRGIEGFESKVRSGVRGRSEELERLALEMYARGLSTRDIEKLFQDENGVSFLPKSAVSEITEALWKEYEEFSNRDLSDIQPLYLFADGIAEKLRPGAPREAVLVAWAISWSGKKVLVHVSPGSKESTDCCREFFEGMKRRGLSDPLVACTDGAAGLMRGVEECFPSSLRQRCLAHKMRNIGNKLCEQIEQEFKQAARAAYQAPSVEMARVLRQDLVDKYGKEYPSAVACFEEDFESCTAHLKCPTAHRRMIRTTNLLERLFLEERRRTRPAQNLFGERAVLKLTYAALIRGSENWRGIQISEFERRQLEVLQSQLQKADKERNSPSLVEIKPRTSRIHSKDRT